MKKRKSERGREIEKERATHRTIYANNEPDFFLSFFIYFFFPLHYKKKMCFYWVYWTGWRWYTITCTQLMSSEEQSTYTHTYSQTQSEYTLASRWHNLAPESIRKNKNKKDMRATRDRGACVISLCLRFIYFSCLLCSVFFFTLLLLFCSLILPARSFAGPCHFSCDSRTVRFRFRICYASVAKRWIIFIPLISPTTVCLCG